jgi:hypothetical protein
VTAEQFVVVFDDPEETSADSKANAELQDVLSRLEKEKGEQESVAGAPIGEVATNDDLAEYSEAEGQQVLHGVDKMQQTTGSSLPAININEVSDHCINCYSYRTHGGRSRSQEYHPQ